MKANVINIVALVMLFAGSMFALEAESSKIKAAGGAMVVTSFYLGLRKTQD